MSTTDYGVFANLVATTTSLAAAAAAVALTFTKRAEWQPPQEAVPLGVSRLSALITMVGVALLYVFSARMGSRWLAVVTVVALVAALVALVVAIRTNIKYAFYFPPVRQEDNRRLGGDRLTDEAAAIVASKQLSWQQLFEDAQGDKDLVWTRESQASVHIRSTLSYIFLIGTGACAIAAAGMLVATSTQAPSTTEAPGPEAGQG